MSQNNINIFQDTMEILGQGYYITDGKKIKLKLLDFMSASSDKLLHTPDAIYSSCVLSVYQLACHRKGTPLQEISMPDMRGDPQT